MTFQMWQMSKIIALILSSDSNIRVYDRRYLSYVDFSSPGCPTDKHSVPVKAFTIPSYEDRPFRVTSVSYSSDETELLVSYSSDHLYLFDATKEVKQIKIFFGSTDGLLLINFFL